VHQRPPGLRREPAAKLAVRDGRLVLEVGGQDRVVVVGDQVDQAGGEPGVGGAVRPGAGAAGAQPAGRGHRDDRRGQLLGDGLQHAPVVRATAVDLVHEHEGGDVEPLQRPHQHAGLRLHALHGRDHQHGAVEHVQHPFHLGDEVRVPGRVDQVDGDVADDEGHHRGLDRDAALPFQRQGVGLGAAVVDAADLVDDAGGVQQPLGQGRLTGVDVRQDPEVQGSHCASCPLGRWWPLLGGHGRPAHSRSSSVGCCHECSRMPTRRATDFPGPRLPWGP
jgi:hypothetical protein